MGKYLDSLESVSEHIGPLVHYMRKEYRPYTALVITGRGVQLVGEVACMSKECFKEGGEVSED